VVIKTHDTLHRAGQHFIFAVDPGWLALKLDVKALLLEIAELLGLSLAGR